MKNRQRPVPRVIFVISWRFLHRVVARQRGPIRCDDRVAIGPRRAVAEHIFGEELAVDFYSDAISELGEIDVTGG